MNHGFSFAARAASDTLMGMDLWKGKACRRSPVVVAVMAGTLHWSLSSGVLLAQGGAPVPASPGSPGGLTVAPAPASAPVKKIEPGLEEAVEWKWRVVPSDKAAPWGLPLPEKPAADSHKPAGEEKPVPVERRPTTYQVQKGDAIIKIARKFNMTPAQLMQFNEMKNDRIVVGQMLDIPTPGELLVMEPPPPPAPPKEEAGKGKGKGKGAGKGKSGEPAEEKTPEQLLAQEPTSIEQLELETVLLQVFLDRELFSCGAIDGKRGPLYQKLNQLYLEAHPEIGGPAPLKLKAIEVVRQPYVNYALRAEDFHFIQPRQAAPGAAEAATGGAGKPAPVHPPKGGRKGSVAVALPPVPPPTYGEMTAADFLGYASAWEFVAERFHCDETFLRHLNPNLPAKPTAGAIFQVPNVIPFEVEKMLEAPLQPAADPAQPVMAAVADLSLLKISRAGKLIAVMPLASARPGLRGRGYWIVQEAIPAPRLITRHEPREAAKTAPPPASPAGAPSAPTPVPGATATDEPPQEPEQSLAAGPNNPVGVVWLNLAKAQSREPLPYGLHGTSIPGQMKSLEGIGGLRMTNWDIARAARLMPPGTPLQW